MLEIDYIPEVSTVSTCSSCRQVTPVSGNWDKFSVEEADVETYELGQISIVRCTFCRKSLGLLEEAGTLFPISEIMPSLDLDKGKRKTDGWHKVETNWERKVVFVLSQIVYKEMEMPDETLMEVEFSFPPPTDLVKLLWVSRQPVGVYSAKLLGTLDLHMMGWYTMTTLDTLFIRQSHRGKGLGTSAIKDLRLEFPQENIGFSYPISIPMGRVLRKYLEVTPSDRPRFWEITGCGTEGNTRNLWLMFHHQSKSMRK